MPNSIHEPSATATPEYHLLKFLTGLVFVSGFFIAVVGLLIVGELRQISASREVIQANWLEQQAELSRRMDSQQDQIGKRIDDLSAKVEKLLEKQAERKDL